MLDNYMCPDCGMLLHDVQIVTHDVAKGFCIECNEDKEVLTANDSIIMDEIQTICKTQNPTEKQTKKR